MDVVLPMAVQQPFRCLCQHGLPWGLLLDLNNNLFKFWRMHMSHLLEDFGPETIGYNDQMIILSPQLNDWGQTSANEAIALTEYFLNHYNINPRRVYLHGMSGGEETGLLIMGTQPELFTAYLATSFQWDGDLNVLAQARTPVYLAIGAQDSYHGADSFIQTYNALRELYARQGLSEEEIDKLLVLDVKPTDFFTERGFGHQHAGGQAFAHEKDIMG